MEYRPLGHSDHTDIKVSAICLGTMTWGQQNTQAEGFEQMDYALAQGVNFFDTAEAYPIPPMAKTHAETERIIGRWFKERGTRDQVVLATKVAGRTPSDWFREGGIEVRLNAQQIEWAAEQSLKRLQTDRIDLYQLHWPDRRIPNFGLGGLGYKRYKQQDPIAPHETLEALSRLVKAGKVRYVGLSNETPWGLQAFLKAADQHDLPRVVSVQNAYNLVNRAYEIGMSEFFFEEQVGLLAYSPLAQGFLSGKYLDGAKPEGARFTLFDRGQRYQTVQAESAIRSYLDIAARHQMDPTMMANAFVTAQPFVTSNIIGATTMEQLRIAIEGCQLELSEEVIKEINEAHVLQPNPCP
ncbi:MAG: aldo/keto reductase [Gammaproteobacteria bacterium]